MTTDNIPCKCIATLAALALAFALLVMPNTQAYAADVVVYDIDAEIPLSEPTQPVDGDHLRHLLVKPELTPVEQSELERVIDETFEEFADAAGRCATAHPA